MQMSSNVNIKTLKKIFALAWKKIFFCAHSDFANTKFSKKKPQKDPLNIKILKFLFLP